MLTNRTDTLTQLFAPDRLAGLLLLFTLPMQSQVMADWYQHQRDIMGTQVSVELWHDQATLAADCSEQVFTEMRRVEALMSPQISASELSFINNNAAVAALEISAEMQHLIEKSLYFSRISEGAFDITFASVGYAYDYRERLKPSAQVIAHNLPAIDYRHILLDANQIRFGHSAVRIDLGGIAKGYAVDRAADIVHACGISEAMISAGGDSRIIGDRRGRPWVIGIKHPRAPDHIALRLPLEESAISTSGDYERFFIEDGERIHHIIDPSTGRPAASSWSATVTGPDAMTTDALSTTIFVLGAAAGIELVESLDGIDAIVIDNHGKIHYSSGFQIPETEG